MNNTETCAILGLGLIGSAWARNLNTDKVLVATWNRSPKNEIPLFTTELETIPTRASILHLVVSDEFATTSVIDRLVSKLASQHLVIQSATIDPATSTLLKNKVESSGASYVEAPFTGSLPAAENRKTIFFLGGSPRAIERARPYLQRLSTRQFLIGTNAQACTLKLVMNLQIVSAVQALAEAISISRNAGISDAIFYDAFRENASFSGVAALKESKIKNNDYSPQFSVKHMSKDMRLLESSAAPSSLPILSTIRNILKQAESNGFSEEDFTAIIKLLNNSTLSS